MAKIILDDPIGQRINQWHESQQEPPRPHMGCSLIGTSCERWLWLSFRWAVIEPFQGRILRLFRRGQNEEETVVQDLESIGCVIEYTGDNQRRISFGSHVSGSLDGIIRSGLPTAPKTEHLLEIKTHGLKSFQQLKKHGVEKSKHQHYVQMQLYMKAEGLTRALYYAVCKDNDEIYTERIKYDNATALKYLDRGIHTALTDRMPPPLSTKPDWYECKWCAAHSFCHEKAPIKERNCRTCKFSKPEENSTWSCQVHGPDIPVEFQRVGCDRYEIHAEFAPNEPLKESEIPF